MYTYVYIHRSCSGNEEVHVLHMDVWTTNRTHLLPLPGQLRVGGVEEKGDMDDNCGGREAEDGFCHLK